VVGINLMPRMRNIKDLVLYKADRRRKYKHIDSLCRQAIDWALIERHYADMMRVAVSIKAGRMTPSTILRRLGSESTKNKGGLNRSLQHFCSNTEPESGALWNDRESIG
jgi:TnpA family transposase